MSLWPGSATGYFINGGFVVNPCCQYKGWLRSSVHYLDAMLQILPANSPIRTYYILFTTEIC